MVRFDDQTWAWRHALLNEFVGAAGLWVPGEFPKILFLNWERPELLAGRLQTSPPKTDREHVEPLDIRNLDRAELWIEGLRLYRAIDHAAPVLRVRYHRFNNATEFVLTDEGRRTLYRLRDTPKGDHP